MIVALAVAVAALVVPCDRALHREDAMSGTAPTRELLLVALIAVFLVACGRGDREAEADPDGAPEGEVPMDASPGGALDPASLARYPTTIGSLPQAGDTAVTGVVRPARAGPVPGLTVNPASGGSVSVTGELAREIGGLVGLEVMVWGTTVPHADPPPVRAIDARGYEIVAANGGRPIVGMLTATGTSIVTFSGDTIDLDEAPDDLRRRGGAMIWIVGPLHDGTVSVEDHGVIRDGTMS